MLIQVMVRIVKQILTNGYLCIPQMMTSHPSFLSNKNENSVVDIVHQRTGVGATGDRFVLSLNPQAIDREGE